MTRGLMGIVAVVLMAALAVPAAASELDELRAEGVIVERYDGYVELRGEGGAEAEKVVEKVNARRREIYEKRAEEQEVEADQVGKVYAEQIVEQAPEGTYFLKPDGGYIKK